MGVGSLGAGDLRVCKAAVIVGTLRGGQGTVRWLLLELSRLAPPPLAWILLL
jgi:hypothetical protein